MTISIKKKSGDYFIYLVIIVVIIINWHQIIKSGELTYEAESCFGQNVLRWVSFSSLLLACAKRGDGSQLDWE